MAEKTVKSRIQVKRGTSTEWQAAHTNSSFTPLEGEIIFYSDLNKMKIGDGKTLVSSLPFLHVGKSEIDNWSHNHDDRYYTESEIDGKLAGKSDTGHTHTTTIAASTAANELTLAQGAKYAITAGGDSFVFTMPTDTNTWRPIGTGANDAAAGNHTHDGRYYTESEIDTKLAGKSNTDHTHNYAGSSSAGGAANSVKTALTFSTSGNGAGNGTTYNGSTARTISYNSVGAAAASHKHTISDVTDFAHNHDDRYYTESEVDALLAEKGSTHEHPYLSDTTKYAGSDSIGGAATSAKKLTNTTKIGDVDQPVYFKADGTPAAISKVLGTAAYETIYTANQCTSFTSDSGTITPLAAQKGVKMFAYAGTLTSYKKASSVSAVSASDTISSAIGKLEKALDSKADDSDLGAQVTYNFDSSTGTLTITTK